MNLFLILLLLALIVAIFLFPFFILLWVDSNMYKKSTKRYDHHLYQKIEQILRRARTKETVSTQLTQLLQQHGYRCSYKNREIIVFRPKSLFGKKRAVRIDISRYPDRQERLHALKIHAAATIGLLSKIAKADGKISKKEADYITRTITRFVSMIKQQGATQQKALTIRKYLVNVHKEAKENIHTTVSSYAKTLQNTPRHSKTKVLQQLLKIANLDGLSPHKEQLIFDAGLAMSIDIRYIQQLMGKRSQQRYRQKNKQQHSTYSAKKTKHIPEHYRILECTPSDDAITIKKKYRALVKQYHPDFTESQRTDKAVKAQLLQKMQDINLAYEKVKKEKKL